MDFEPSFALLLVGFISAYLFGSLPSGLLLTKIFMQEDIRNVGSGNIGATNVLRTGNKCLAFTTLGLDILKAVLPLIIFSHFIFADYQEFVINRADELDRQGVSTLTMKIMANDYLHFMYATVYCPLYHTMFGLFAILGHCYPVWLKFKGGKGVATTFGVLFVAVPWAGFLAAVTWGIVAGFSRYSSLAALSAVALTPLFTFIYYGTAPAIITILIALLVIWRHKENIKRLTAGTEPKIGASKKKDTDEPAATQE